MLIFILTRALYSLSEYYLHQTNPPTPSTTCNLANPCASLDLFEELAQTDGTSVDFAADILMHVYDFAELNGAVSVGPFVGTMNIKYEGDSGWSVLQGGGTITFQSNITCDINAIFQSIKVWSYHVVNDQWQTSIIACVDHTTVEFIDCVIADYATEISFPLPDRYSLVCIWDGQIAAVRVANTKCNIVNTTFDGICLGGLSLRNALPWVDVPAGESGIVLTIDTFLFRGNRWPQPTEDGVRAYVPNRNLFALSESTDERVIIIDKGDADYDGGEDLSGPLEIYDRGVVFKSVVNGTPVIFTPTRSAPSFDDLTISVSQATTREATIVTMTVTGSNFFRCGSNAITISPYFNGKAPDNPTWRTIPIVKETGMETIVAQAKSSDIWPAGQWMIRATIAAENYIQYDVQGVSAFSPIPLFITVLASYVLIFF
ncbi:hypothetical protein BLNAU_7794 [Blattamonas nauphoetae]|uniref:Uncharacterized protein n=1 Tax=Blattamonas nauphoetae TaxID=2049346 RepID=A0ABQ9Y0C8_9EUKA|nr:hypothetical protein BLNAU_7794 [Blattamonas nauphoetae]